MRSKNKKRGLMLLGLSLLLGVIYFNSPLYGKDFNSNSGEMSKPQNPTENSREDNTETVMRMAEIDGETISVRAWHNEEDNRYYFFLPERSPSRSNCFQIFTRVFYFYRRTVP